MRPHRTLTALLAVTALLAACGNGNDDQLAGVDLGAADATDEDGATGDVAATDDRTTDDTSTDAADAAEAAGDTAAGEVVDLTTAVPGTWPVGDAGTVTFSLAGGRLVLEDVSTADGWTSRIDEEDDDELEVDFERDGVSWEFEVEVDDGRLEVELRQDLRDAQPGSYDLADAGSFAFEVADGRLTLTTLDVADGWELTEREEDADEFEFELRQGEREFDVEVELDDGRVEVEIDYKVTGPITG
jgi:hypothetical protein